MGIYIDKSTSFKELSLNEVELEIIGIDGDSVTTHRKVLDSFIELPEHKPDPVKPDDDNKEGSKSRLGLWIGIGIAVFLLVLIVVVTLVIRHNRKKQEDYFRASLDHNVSIDIEGKL